MPSTAATIAVAVADPASSRESRVAVVAPTISRPTTTGSQTRPPARTASPTAYDVPSSPDAATVTRVGRSTKAEAPTSPARTTTRANQPIRSVRWSGVRGRLWGTDGPFGGWSATEAG